MNVRLEGFHCVGYVKAAHGISGELFVQIFSPEADWVPHTETLFLLPREKSNSSDFQKIEQFKLKRHKTGFILKTPAIKDRNLAETFKGCGVYIPEENLRAEPGERIFLHEIQGFDIADKNGRVLAKITDFSSNGAQDLLVVQTMENKSALVPFVEAFIVEVDFAGQVVTMDLPPGLLNVDEIE